MYKSLTLFAFGLVFLLVIPKSNAQESKFYALFITKFSENVIWPENLEKVRIGVIGDSKVFDHLVLFSKAKSNLEVVRVTDNNEAGKCQMLFLPKSDDGKIEDILTVIGGKSILLISENDKLTGKGSDIGFFLNDGKLRFLLSEESIKGKNLVVSNNLKALGRTI